MTIREINSNYILNDGQIISCSINFVGRSSVNFLLKVRIQIKKEIKPIMVELIISDVTELNIYEDFTSENYSDITLLKLESGEYYLSLGPFDNSNKPNENDNFVVKGKILEIAEK